VKSKSSTVLRLAVRDLLGEQRRQEIVIAPLLLLGPRHEVTPGAAGVGEAEALEGGVEVEIEGGHAKSSCCTPRAAIGFVR
jgi:hypothetical protein